MASKEARVPDSDNDWQSIDIYVFSNGQQYTPPRKYHLRMADLNWWKSTLSSLAKSQYGASDSDIDLFTLEGKKVVGPLDLSNGASYVAVRAADNFVDTGYDKYLIKASRSWEKRQAKKSENEAEPEESKMLTKNHHEMARTDVRVEPPSSKSREPSVVLKTIVSSVVDHDASVIVKPHPQTGHQSRIESHRTTTVVKQIEKKKSLVQRPVLIKKIPIPPPAIPTPNGKTDFDNKRKETIKLANAKIARSERDRRNSERPAIYSNNPTNRMSAKSKIFKPTVKPRHSYARPEEVVTKIMEKPTDIKECSTVKTAGVNELLATSSTDFKNIIDDKEIVLVSNLYRNPYKDITSLLVNPNLEEENLKEQIELANCEEKSAEKIDCEIKCIATKSNNEIDTVNSSHVPKIAIICNKVSEMTNVKPRLDGKTYKEFYTESKTNIPDSNRSIKIYYSPPRRGSIKIEKRLIEPHAEAQIVEENKDFNNEIKTDISEGNDNPKSQSLPPIVEKLLENQNLSYMNYNTTNNEVNVATLMNVEPSKSLASPRYSIATDKPLDDQNIKNNKNHDTGKENVKRVSNEVKINAPDVKESTKNSDFASRLPTSLDERYAAIISKGDVVNLNLNIEIQSHDGNLIKHNDNIIKLHSITNILHTEKGSQVDISMIKKEANDYHIGDNHHVIIVQCSSCKYCKDHSSATADKKSNKNYVIVLPAEKVAENIGCHCDEGHYSCQNRCSSVVNPVKPMYSCMSLERITKLNQVEQYSTETTSHNIVQDCRHNDNVTVERKPSEKEIIVIARKKSVVINESQPITRESSKQSHEVIKTELIIVNRDSVIKLNKIVVENSTQTEWCDVLLEVKVHEDGHYTFRLPSLEVIKHYQLG